MRIIPTIKLSKKERAIKVNKCDSGSYIEQGWKIIESKDSKDSNKQSEIANENQIDLDTTA